MGILKVRTAQVFLTVLCTLGVLSTAQPSTNATYCWGNGDSGQLGLLSSSNIPVDVSAGESFSALASGGAHVCGLKADASAWCWGNGAAGQLGNGGNSDAYSPSKVSGQQAFTAITAGQSHTCGLAESQVLCWGQTAPGSSSDVPVEVEGGFSLASISAGSSHTCGVQANGQAVCWGSGLEGQLGNGVKANSASPVLVTGGLTFSTVSAGQSHSCGLAAGAAWCWGSGEFGQTGLLSSSDVPVDVSSGQSFVALASGAFHLCALHADGTIWCWGRGLEGQLGNGANSNTYSPVQVAGGQKFTSVAAGGDQTCGLAADGAYCWGSGPLGDGTSLGSNTPVKVSEDNPILTIDVGGSQTCALVLKALPPSPAPEPLPSPSLPSPTPEPSPSPSSAAPVLLPSPSLPQSPLPPPSSPSPSVEETSPSPDPSGNDGALPPSPEDNSSSSVPIGAIVGGVVGGLAVLSALAFFALRPGKGWLRAKAPVEMDALQVPPTLPGKEVDTFVPMQAAYDAHTVDTFLPHSRAADSQQMLQQVPTAAVPVSILPASYVSSLGASSHQAQSPQATGGVANHSLSVHSLESDPTLSYIASCLASRVSQQAEAAPLRAAAGGSSNLRPEVQLWEVLWQDVTIEHPIGQGSFGNVYLGRWQQTPVAVKVLINRDDIGGGRDNLELPATLMRQLQEEAAVMVRMRHPNIVGLMGLCVLPPALLTEYCSKGSLYSILRNATQDASEAAELTWKRRLSIALDAATGLLYLHSRSIIHRDMKSPNLLVDKDWNAKRFVGSLQGVQIRWPKEVSDFNLSKLMESQQSISTSTAGANNPLWMAPECLEGGRATAASDIFSFGIVLFELLTWKLPWAGTGMSQFQIGNAVMRGGRPEVPPFEALPGPDTVTFAGLDIYCEVMRECWAQDPATRPPFAAIIPRLRALLDENSG